MSLQRSFEAVEHPNTLLITVAECFILRATQVVLATRHVQMMDGFGCLSASPIHPFYLVAKVSIAVFLRQIRCRTVRRPPHLRSKFILLFVRPLMTCVADINVKVT